MQSKFRKANTQFAVSLLAEAFAQSADKSVQVSPFSVRRALTMAAIGARGATRRAFLDTFQLPSGVDLSQVNEDNNSFLTALLAAEKHAQAPTEINVANALWLKKDEGAGYRFLDAFKAANQRYYNAPTNELDFVPSDVDVINAWCAKNTNNKIAKILAEIPGGARAFLTDALYMKTPANLPFRKRNDEKGTFTPLGGKARPVNFMVHPWEELDHYKGDDVEIVRFPFGECGAFNGYLLLPAAKSSLGQLLSSLSGATWLDWKSRLHAANGKLRLPPNEQEYSNDLKAVLCNLGLGVAFSDELADFLDMCTGRLKIGAVQHKTYTKFMRKGFEGAAVTCVGMVECTSVGAPKPTFDISFDRPYAWFVEGNDEILFAATTPDPKEPGDFASESDED